MAPTALLAGRHGAIRTETEAVVSAFDCTVAERFVVDAAEDNRYHLPPGLLDRLVAGIEAADADRVIIDGLVHAGQMADLQERLPTVTLADWRDICYEQLAAGGNTAAEICLKRRSREIERRRAIRAQRAAETAGPSGESGAVSELEAACDRLDEQLSDRQDRQSRRVEQSYQGVDAHAVLVGSVRAGTTYWWEGLTGENGEEAALLPAVPTTAVTTIGTHEVAVTDTPALVAGAPEWLTAALPGTVAAIERADLLLVAGASGSHNTEKLLPTTNFDGTVLTVASPEDDPDVTEQDTTVAARAGRAEQIEAEIEDHLPTMTLAVTLPYTDEAEAMVSRLYDEATVKEIQYGERIRLSVTVPEESVDQLTGRIERIGEVTEAGDSE